MQEFEGKVAVVTGGASGMGRAFAERFAEAGMKVVLADVEEDALEAAAAEMRRSEYEVLPVRTDVSSADSVQNLAAETLREFGAVHVVCNNAGVGAEDRPIWEAPDADWDWVFGVNFWGVLHGLRAFVPIMLEQGEEGHIVNTASLAALWAGGGIYGASKHAVLSLTETLSMELRQRRAPIGVSVLCPGIVNTNIADAARNRPPELTPADTPTSSPASDFMRGVMDLGMDPRNVAEQVFSAVRDNTFYILSHPDWDESVRERVERILARERPMMPVTERSIAAIRERGGQI